MSAGLKVWLVFAFLALGLSVLMLLDGAAQVQARPATLNLAEGERQVVACEANRLLMHRVDAVHAVLYCVGSESPLPTPLPPRP